MENETIEIVKELPPAKVMLVALDLGKWDCERSLAELSALAVDDKDRHGVLILSCVLFSARKPLKR